MGNDYHTLMKPFHLGSRFPARELVLFGEAQRQEGAGIANGYVSLRVHYPYQANILDFTIDDITTWQTYVPQDIPSLSEIKFDFTKVKGVVEAKMLNPIALDEPDMDIFEVSGGALYTIEQEEAGTVMRYTNILNQVLDFYSRFLRKSIVALRRTDNVAARIAIVDMSREYQAIDKLSSHALNLDRLLKEAFVNFTSAILEESN